MRKDKILGRQRAKANGFVMGRKPKLTRHQQLEAGRPVDGRHRPVLQLHHSTISRRL
jgi:hypothetical protein